jgi:hypothetical protein
MNMRAILVILVLAALAACTPMQWVRDEAQPEQVSQDLMSCQQDAWREAQSYSWYYRPFGPFGGHHAFGRPFAFPGSPYYDPFTDPQLQEARLTQFCMHNKGYELKPAEQNK